MILVYAEAWANLMETEMAHGIAIEDCAMVTSYQADPDRNLTGFAYRIAVSVLGAYWVHGKQIQRWYSQQRAQPGTSKVH